MKKIVINIISAGVLAVLASGTATAEQIYTGDTRLACEAILCLSSSQRPDECSASLNRYFSITRLKWSNTLKARRSFLKMCPTANDIAANMPQLVEDIVNGAGRCDADYLNRTQLARLERKVCKGFGKVVVGNSCTTETYLGIKNTPPNYCVAYWGNNYTDVDVAKYVGTMEQDGKWVPNKDFVTEQARWEQAHPPKQEAYPWLKY